MHEAKSNCALLLFTVLATASATEATSASSLTLTVEGKVCCAETVLVNPGESYRGGPGRIGEIFRYGLYLQSPGALIAGTSVPGLDHVEPKLRLRDPARAGADVSVVDRGPAFLVLRIHKPGSYVFEVAAQDERTALGEHTFISRFVADADAEVWELGGPAMGLSKDGEIGEIDPILLVSPPDDAASAGDATRLEISRPGLLRQESGRMTLVRPGREFWVGGVDPLVLHFYDLCRPDPADGLENLLLCASSVHQGHPFRGEITDGWIPDHDARTFVLTEQRTVKIEALADMDTIAVLFDRWGNRLAVADSIGGRGKLHLVKTLAPGRYFIRIESRDGMPGAYSLSFALLPW